MQAGDRVRYVGQDTDKDVWAIVEHHPDCPEGKVALRLKNNLLMFSLIEDCIPAYAVTWPMDFPGAVPDV